MSDARVLICPYCGQAQPSGERCRACGGFFEPLSRQASHNAMGPWFVRDPRRPFQPGCSYETLVRLIERRTVNKTSIIRGPTTRQFWTVARRVPGVSHLLGYCHHCDASVDPGDHGCHACGAAFGAYLDRNDLGLPEIRALPWEADVDEGPPGDSPREDRLGWRPRPPGTGMSSFASDDELLGSGWRGGPGVDGGSPARTHSAGPGAVIAPGGPRTPAASSVLEAPAAAPPSLPSAESAAVSAAQRALQRRLARQERTIRALWVAVMLLTVIAGILVIALRPPLPPGASSRGTAPAARPPGTESSTPGPPPVSPPEASPRAAAAAPPDAVLASPPEASPHDDSMADLQRALELLRQADDITRPVAERTADCTSALEILNRMQASTSAADLPEGFEAVLREARRAQERLELTQFYP
jgi:hypothetical protein